MRRSATVGVLAGTLLLASACTAAPSSPHTAPIPEVPMTDATSDLLAAAAAAGDGDAVRRALDTGADIEIGRAHV